MNAEAKQKVKQMKGDMTGADLLIQTLEAAEVETVFGYPGGAVLPIYDALYRSDASFTHILTRHEQGAVHAAEGYARVTGHPGVVLSTSGPGATNLMTGITDAMMDSLPLVIFTGQVATSAIGSDAFQESDVMGMTTPVTKYNYQVRDLTELPRIVKEAFHIASTGRPGPVVVDIPKDIASAVSADIEHVDASSCRLPGYQPNQRPNPLQILKLAEALGRSEKPLILAGAGVVFAEAAPALKTLAERYQIPVVNTLHGLGSFPGTHELSFGMAGMHGSYAANMGITDCDLLLNIGARFDDRLTGKLQYFAPHAKVAHIDIDPAEIGKNIATDIPVVADAGKALEALLKREVSMEQQDVWLETLKGNRSQYPFWYDRQETFISPQWLIEQIYHISNGEAIVTTDVGQHQMWAAQYYPFDQPNRWVTSGGLGTMGFGFPAAIGAQLGAPEDLVVAVVGDGGFQMTAQELSVISERQMPVKVVIVNNQSLGMVRQWQESFYDKRYSESIFPENPDFVKLAACYGIRGMRADQESEVADVLTEAFTYDGPVVIDCRVAQDECVYPMIAPGKGIHDMIGVTR